MKKLVSTTYFIVAALLCGSAHAQTADVSWGDDLAFSKTAYSSAVIGENQGSFFALNSAVGNGMENEIRIEKFSKTTLALETSFTVYTKTMYGAGGAEKQMEYVTTLDVNDGIIVFFSEFSKNDKGSFTAYAQKFDFNGKKSGEFKQLDVFMGNEKTVIGQYNVLRSPFGNGFILCYSRPFILYSDEYFRFRCYDYSLNQQWEREFVFPFKGKEFEMKQIRASVDSTVYVMVRVLEDNEEEREKKGNTNITYSYTLLSFNAHPSDTNRTFRMLPISVNKKFVADISYSVNDRREVICAGLFADKKDMAVSGGFYTVIESVSGAVRTSSTIDFEKPFIAKFLDTENLQRGAGMRDFIFRDLIINADGSTLLVGEQQFGRVVCKNVDKPAEMTCETQSFFNDILVMKVNNLGKIEWVSNVPKRSADMDKGFGLSYTMLNFNNKLVFLYNDIAKNLQTNDPAIMKHYKGTGGSGVAAVVNSKGEVSRDLLFEGADSKVLIVPTTSKPYGENEVVVYSFNGKKARWARLKLY